MPDSQQTEVPKAASGEAGKKVEQYSKEQIIQALESGTQILANELNNPQNQLSPEEQWAFYSIKGAQEQHGTDPANKVDLKSGKDTFTNTFTDNQTGKTFTQEEGIPVEGLIPFLKKMIPGTSDAQQRADIQNIVKVLQKSSHTYTQLHPTNGKNRTETAQFQARKKQEAYFISTGIRATGSMDEDLAKADATLKHRRELRFPPQKPQTVAPETESSFETPTSWDNQPTVEVTAPTPNPVTPEIQNTPDLTNPAPATPEVQTTPNTQPEITQEITPTEVNQNENATPPESEEPVTEPQTPIRETIDIDIINAMESVDKLAHDQARKVVAEFLRHSDYRWFDPRNWAARIGVRLGEGGAVNMLTDRLRAAMVENNTSLLEGSHLRQAAANINELRNQSATERQALVDRFKSEGLTDREERIEVQGQLKDEILHQLIEPITAGTITNQDQVRTALTEFVQNHREDQQVQALFGAGASDFGSRAEYFASDIMDMGLRVRESMQAHNESLDQMSQYINIHLGLARDSYNTDVRTTTDRAVAWARARQSDNLTRGARGIVGIASGVILNPLVVGAAVSIASSGILRSLGWAGKVADVPAHFLVGAGAGGIAASARRYIELGKDVRTHAAERTLGEALPQTQHATGLRGFVERMSGGFRREDLEQFRRDSATANELIHGGGNELVGGGTRASVDMLASLDLSQPGNQETVARRIAEIRTRVNRGRQQRQDFVQFSNKAQVNQELNQLLQSANRLEEALRASGADATQLEITQAQNWNTALDDDAHTKNSAFRNYRLRNAAGAGVFAGAVGIAGGVALHKGMDVFGIGVTHATETAGIPSPISHEHLQEVYNDPAGGNIDLGNHLSAQINPDHSVLLSQDGQPIPNAPQVEINTDGHLLVHGDLPQNLQDQLNSDGFKINQLEAAGIDQKPVLGPEGAWTTHATHVDHREWYSYDKPLSQGNELRLYDAKQGGAVTLDINNMKLGYQHDLNPNPIDVQKVIANHEAGWYFSSPSTPQDGIWVSDGADGVWDGQLTLDPNDLDPTHIIQTSNGPIQLGEFSKMVLNGQALQQYPDGNLATELYSRQDVFNLGEGGKFGFIEAGRMPADRPGIMQVFATIRGQSALPSTIDIPKPGIFEIIPPEAATPLPLPGEAPWIPTDFAPRHPLDRLWNPESLPPDIYYRPYGAVEIQSIEKRRKEFPVSQVTLDNLDQLNSGILIGRESGIPSNKVETVDPIADFREAVNKADDIFIVFPYHIGDSLAVSGYARAIDKKLAKLGNQATVHLVVPNSLVSTLQSLESPRVKIVPGGQEEPRIDVSVPNAKREHEVKGIDTALSEIKTNPDIHNAVLLDFENLNGGEAQIIKVTAPDKSVVSFSPLFQSTFAYGVDGHGDNRYLDFASEILNDPDRSEGVTMPSIPLPKNSDELYTQVTERHGIDSTRPQISIVLESGSTGRQYSIEKWAAIANTIQNQYPNMQFNFIVNKHKAADNPTNVNTDTLQKAIIANGLKSAYIVDASIPELLSLFSKQNLVLSNDGGVLHVASLVEKGPPVIGLYFPGFSNHWRLNPNKTIGIEAPPGLEDYGVEWGQTDENKKWINKIPPEEVAQKALSILQGIPTPVIPEVRSALTNIKEETTERLAQLQNQMSAIAEQMKSSTFSEGQKLGAEMQRAVTEFNKLTKRANRTPKPTPPTAPTPIPTSASTQVTTPALITTTAPTPKAVAAAILTPPEEPIPASETLTSEVNLKQITAAEYSETNPAHPNENQDSVFTSREKDIAGVFDGMGGMKDGALASRTARETIEPLLSQIPENATPQEIEQAIQNALRAANEKVRQITPDGGTTASVVKVWTGPNGEQKVILGNIGDSRIWLYKKDGTLTSLSQDDSVIKDDFLHGKLSEERYNNLKKLFDSVKTGIDGYTEEIQKYWYSRNVIYRYLGMDNFACETKIVDVEPEDVILLTSDGIHDNLTAEEVQQSLQQAKDPQDATELLVKNAKAVFTHLRLPNEPLNERRKADDTTAAVIKIPESRKIPTPGQI